METESELKVTLVITFNHNYIGNLIQVLLDDTLPEEHRGGVFAGLDAIHREYVLTGQLSSDLYETIQDGAPIGSMDCPRYPDTDYDETFDYVVGICYKYLEERKLPYDKLCNIELRHHESLDKSYIGLVFNVEKIEEVVYAGPCNRD